MIDNENKYLAFCEKNQVTAEHFDRENSSEYLKKRRNLYRQLGIPILAVKDAEILEIGPGVGHNTLPLILDWNCKYVDLVEPNLVAVNELKKTFEELGVGEELYRVFPVIFEEYKEDKKYDMVIAEGYIQYSHNWNKLLKMIKKYTHENSLVIVTCMDEFGIYVEMMKRLVGQYMVKDIEGELDNKVAFLSETWKEYFKTLPGMTRTPREWILDMIFNEGVLCCEKPMTIKYAMEEMKDEFDVLGCSQNLFVDYSWYKDLDYDYINAYQKQYDMKKHMFLTADTYEESVHDMEINKKLEEAIKLVIDLIRKIESGKDITLEILCSAIDGVTMLADNQRIQDFNEDIKNILKEFKDEQEIDFTKYKAWNTTFGRAMQYISFQRK